MSHAQKILEAKIQIGGELDKSLQKSIKQSNVEFDKLKKKIGSVASFAIKSFAAIGAASAAALGTGMVKMGKEYGEAMTNIATQTGASGDALKEFGDIAREVWKSGKGEDLNDVANAMANIHQSSKLAGEELKAATNAAMTLKDGFGIDVSESTRAASSMMKTFGISAEDAYGLIAYGAQNGANRNGDLVDVLNEYSVQFKALGLNADQFMTSLVTGAEQGAWQIDKIGDAMKEFNIRAKDGSKKSMEAFEGLGLNGKEMTEAFAAGGETAQKAFFKVVQTLKGVDNEVQRNAVGVALFGTMYEDLEKGLLDMAASMETANIQAGETLELVSEAKYSGVNAAITEIGRSFQDAMIPGAEKAGQALKENMPAIKDSINELAPIVEKVATSIGEKLPEAIKWGTDALKKITDFVTENKDALREAGEAAIYLYGTYKTLQGGVAIFNAVKTAVVAYKAAQLAAASSGKTLTVTQWALNAAMSANPVGAITVAVTALVAAIIYCWRNWDEITAKMTAAWKGFEEKFPQTAAVLKQIWEGVCTYFKIQWEIWSGIFTAGWESLKILFGGVRDHFKEIWGAVCAFFKGDWDGVSLHLQNALTVLKDTFSQIWDNIKAKVQSVFDSIKGYIQPIIDSVQGVMDKLNSVKESVSNSKINPANWFAAGGFTNGPSICGEAGTEAVISFDPRYRKENQGYLMTAAEMLGMTAAPAAGSHTSNNISVNFSPVIKSGGENNSALLSQLRACMPELVDMIEEAMEGRKGHRYA